MKLNLTYHAGTSFVKNIFLSFSKHVPLGHMDKAAMKIVEIVVMLQTVSILMALVSVGVFLDTAITSVKHVCAFEQC